MRNWRPIFIENSRIPVWLSYISPIDIGAITLGFIVLSREEMDARVRRHETIHFQQYLETLFIGFILLYAWDWILNRIRFGDGEIAYYAIRSEIEAYENEEDEDYLQNRIRWAWIFEKL